MARLTVWNGVPTFLSEDPKSRKCRRRCSDARDEPLLDDLPDVSVGDGTTHRLLISHAKWPATYKTVAPLLVASKVPFQDANSECR